ncbi:MAG TPA: hypothetical protein ENJ00_05595, partial [Phycisphaerales bacterium]|nr:hypothetical protein [Phycisphaerales bacterium]
MLSPGAGRSRRGTVLLLVLGTLAMVLVLSVVYAALGKGDRRQARAVVQREDTSQSVNTIGEYLARVIADDVTDVVPDLTNPNLYSQIPGANAPIMRRETIDVPMTDSFFRSVPSEVITGTGPDEVNLVSAMRFRPTGGHSADLDWNTNIQSLTGFNIDPRGANDPFLASTRPVDLGASGQSIQLPAYQRELDWLQISNFAPDGRFVNLYYIREDSDSGGFNTPSLDLTRDPSRSGGRASRLSLFNASGAPTDFLPYGDMLAGGTGGSISRDRADWNIPAHWTMNQRQMFRAVNDPTLDTNPSSPDNWQYQYADADGDGIIDSRWMELVDASDPNNPRPILGDSDYRFFIAARAIDLSSLVNVSTATDFVAPPTSSTRVGSGPQEVSLFTLLHMDQHRFAHASIAEANASGIDYSDVFATGSGQPGDYSTYDRAYTRQMGRKANLRIQDSILRGSVPNYGTVPGEQNPSRSFSDDISDYTLLTDADERLAFEDEVGSVYPGVSAGGNFRASPFGVDDLVELLTYHGVNDSDNFSALEQAMVASNTNQNALSLSPLRSDRATDLDIGLESTPIEKYKRSATDIRRMLTTVSGSRPLRSSIVDQADIAFLDADRDLKIRLDDLVLDDGLYPNDADSDTLEDYRNETAELLANTFGVYLKTLAPYLADGGWDTTINSSLQTEYYGGMGPELAVRLAAHSALNFRDMADAPFVDANRNGVPDEASVLDYDLADSTQKALYAQRRDEPTAAVLKLSKAFDLAS